MLCPLSSCPFFTGKLFENKFTVKFLNSSLVATHNATSEALNRAKAYLNLQNLSWALHRATFDIDMQYGLTACTCSRNDAFLKKANYKQKRTDLTPSKINLDKLNYAKIKKYLEQISTLEI